MLVVMRKKGDTLEIGPDVVIQVLEVDRGRVHIGISAPREVEIWRGEVAEERRVRKRKEERTDGR